MGAMIDLTSFCMASKTATGGCSANCVYSVMGANSVPGAPHKGNAASAKPNHHFIPPPSTSARVRGPVPVDDQFRMGADKRVPHVAGETDRRRGRQRFR